MLSFALFVVTGFSSASAPPHHARHSVRPVVHHRRHSHRATEVWTRLILTEPFRPDPRLIGTWWVDVNTLHVSSTNKSPEVRAALAQALDTMRDQVAFANITFKADGSYSAEDKNGKPSFGQYRVHGRSIAMTSAGDDKGPQPKLTLSADGIQLGLLMDTGEVRMGLTLVKL